jgi:hypothetical protein
MNTTRANIHSAEVEKALEALSLPYKLLTAEKSEKIHHSFCKKYAQEKTYQYPLWDHLHEGNIFSVQNPDAWQWFETLLAGKTSYLFFENKDDIHFFEIPDGGQLSAILGECYLFTFYITDPDLSFYFSFNDHEVLTAGGTAVNLLQNYLYSNKIGLRKEIT